MNGFGNYSGTMGSIFMGSGITMFIFWILIIVLLASLFRNSVFITNDVKSPLEVLNERYAKGEITKEEYEEIKKTIK